VKSMAGYEIAVNHNFHSVLLLSVKVEERLRWMIDLKAEISVHNKKLKSNRDVLRRLINAVCSG